MNPVRIVAALIALMWILPGRLAAAPNEGWFDFAPASDPFDPAALLDLRSLNEKFAGEHGFIATKGGQFIFSQTGEPVRFWAVNGPPHGVDGPAKLRRVARMLAKRGVNLVRVHGPMFDNDNNIDPAKVRHALDIVAAMKAEGIYTHFSIYFPLWLKPKAGTPWLKGYDGTKNPFAALFFNPDFQAQYRSWWRALLTTPGTDGRRLVDEPAVMGLEMQNEDSFFFWTFGDRNIPDAELRLLEAQFGDWLKGRYGSIDATLAKWGGAKLNRDVPSEGRVGFRPLWNMSHERTIRDQDTARFLLETQTRFYRETYAFLRELGFHGVITASNWATADPQVLGPLEKLSYTVGDFIDRHGYFSCLHKGEASEWSIRNGHTFADRSALRFDPMEPGKPKQFVHPAMDPAYDDKPSMISETTWNRPNRYRSEAPLYFACYGALQDTDAIVHFALDGAEWSVKPGFWMQPWTLMAPSQAGQFPAAALIFRRGLVHTGGVLADVKLSREDLCSLKGTPLPQDASFDELRAKDVPEGPEVRPGQIIDPLIHYAGQTRVEFVNGPSSVSLTDLKPFADRGRQTVKSSTGELKLDYGRGLLTIDAPAAQGVSGNMKNAGEIPLRDVIFRSDLDLVSIVAVALDGKPLASSRRILLQAMSEERNSGWQTEAVADGVQRIVDVGHDPWQVKELRGEVRFRRGDAAQLKVVALDANGMPVGPAGRGDRILLQSRTIYYVVEAP